MQVSERSHWVQRVSYPQRNPAPRAALFSREIATELSLRVSLSIAALNGLNSEALSGYTPADKVAAICFELLQTASECQATQLEIVSVSAIHPSRAFTLPHGVKTCN